MDHSRPMAGDNYVYLAALGIAYEDEKDLSPTERELDRAVARRPRYFSIARPRMRTST